jgi:hypothetical protein
VSEAPPKSQFPWGYLALVLSPPIPLSIVALAAIVTPQAPSGYEPYKTIAVVGGGFVSVVVGALIALAALITGCTRLALGHATAYPALRWLVLVAVAMCVIACGTVYWLVD